MKIQNPNTNNINYTRVIEFTLYIRKCISIDKMKKKKEPQLRV